jgi:hypothetical protein
MERGIENEIAKHVLSGDFTDGDTAGVDRVDGKLTSAKHVVVGQKASA